MAFWTQDRTWPRCCPGKTSKQLRASWLPCVASSWQAARGLEALTTCAHTQAAGSLCALLTITHPQADCGPHTWLPCIPRGDVSCSWSHPCLPSTGCHILEEVERASFFSQSSAGTHPWSAHICSPNSIQKPKGFLFPTDLTQYYQTHNSISSSCLKRTLWRAMRTPTSPGSSSGPAPVRGQARVLVQLCGRASLAPVPSGHLPALKTTIPQPCIIHLKCKPPPPKPRR